VHRILTNSIIDKLIELSNNNKLKGDNSNLNIRHTYYIINSGKPGSNAFILEYSPMLSNYIASEYNNSDISINNTKS
jgi:hypothetical protein